MEEYYKKKTEDSIELFILTCKTLGIVAALATVVSVVLWLIS